MRHAIVSRESCIILFPLGLYLLALLFIIRSAYSVGIYNFVWIKIIKVDKGLELVCDVTFVSFTYSVDVSWSSLFWLVLLIRCNFRYMYTAAKKEVGNHTVGLSVQN